MSAVTDDNFKSPSALADRIETAIKLHRSLGSNVHFTLSVDAAAALAEFVRLNVALVGKVKELNAEAQRLSSGLLMISGAPRTAPAAVLRTVAYDIALNCIEPDVAEYQIVRRAGLVPAAPEKGESSS